MAPSSRLTSAALAVIALSFASCPVESLLAPGARVSPALSKAAARARKARERLDRDPGPMFVEKDDSTMRTASAKSGDVLADDAEATDADDAGAVDGAKNPPVDDDLALGAIAKETFVYARPSWKSKKIGYLRGG